MAFLVAHFIFTLKCLSLVHTPLLRVDGAVHDGLGPLMSSAQLCLHSLFSEESLWGSELIFCVDLQVSSHKPLGPFLQAAQNRKNILWLFVTDDITLQYFGGRTRQRQNPECFLVR